LSAARDWRKTFTVLAWCFVYWLQGGDGTRIMITQIKFQNFKALKDAELKLGPFNVIVGPNGSGKSSVLQGINALGVQNSINLGLATTVGSQPNSVLITADCKIGGRSEIIRFGPIQNYPGGIGFRIQGQLPMAVTGQGGEAGLFVGGIKVYCFEANSLGHPVSSQQITELQRDGKNLVGALTNLRDQDDDAYNRLLEEFRRWIPEYDNIGFTNDPNGQRHLTLRQKGSRRIISASQASEGTLLTLALLTIVHQPVPPVLIGLEEPDRGLHPRLLRELRDALYRLSFPSDFGIKRAPVQVVVTTHSPFFLDLFKDHPEQVIIAEKLPDGTATFKNLSDDPQMRELIGDAPLGEVWYSGVLGGVPVPA
jgi:predicted ATPase